MSLVLCPDLSPADWIVQSDAPWQQIATFGPDCFPAYARVRFMPDPTAPGQSGSEVDDELVLNEVEVWQAMLHLLAPETTTPDDCYFGLWDGWGFPQAEGKWPTFGIPRDAERPARSFFLFKGSLSDAAGWDATGRTSIWGRPEFSGGGSPALAWPSDHAWCIAFDIDPHWAGVGGSVRAIERLIADRWIDAVSDDPAGAHPFFYS